MTNALFKTLFIGASAFALAACGASDDAGSTAEETAAAPAETEVAAEAEVAEEAAVSSTDKLQAVLDGQSDKAKARYQYRNPAETLAFFGIEPGMTVVDTLPGEVWYSGILSEYLGAEGKVIGADYAQAMWPLFGSFATPELIEAKKTWTETWVADMSEKKSGGAAFAAFQFGALPDDMAGTADAALMIRALHNVHRFEGEGGYLTQALSDMNAVLKPGGILGVVQHRGPEANSDEWAIGSNGYLKQSRVIEAFEAAGFQLVEVSELNANEADQPTEEDFVWRLPPTLAGSEEGSEQREAMKAIGESDRMTLLFKKAE